MVTSQLLLQLAIATGMILFTVIMHASLYEVLFTTLQGLARRLHGIFGGIWKIVTLSSVVLVVFLLHVFTIWLWAHLLLFLDVEPLADLETALYFTTCTYTTVGYGDVVAENDWRLLAATISADGLILAGWTVAFLYEIMNKLHSRDVIKF